jgi:hypothetical protein
VPTKTLAHGLAPASQDYAVIRLELDELDKRILAKRDAVVAAADPPKPKKATALTDAPLIVITTQDVADSEGDGWAEGAGAALPNYAILLTDPGAPVPPPAPKGERPQ